MCGVWCGTVRLLRTYTLSYYARWPRVVYYANMVHTNTHQHKHKHHT